MLVLNIRTALFQYELKFKRAFIPFESLKEINKLIGGYEHLTHLKSVKKRLTLQL